MNGTRATLAIVRREMDTRWLIGRALALAVGLAAGLSSEAGLVAAAALWFAVSGALRIDVRDGMYFTAPLYGRQLARAHALVALAGAFAAPAGTFAAWAIRGAMDSEFAPAGLALPLLCAVTLAAVVALSATPRTGIARGAYALGAWVLGATTLVPYFLALHDAAYVALAPALLAGFIALRAFGETLARYDPIAET